MARAAQPACLVALTLHQRRVQVEAELYARLRYPMAIHSTADRGGRQDGHDRLQQWRKAPAGWQERSFARIENAAQEGLCPSCGICLVAGWQRELGCAEQLRNLLRSYAG